MRKSTECHSRSPPDYLPKTIGLQFDGDGEGDGDGYTNEECRSSSFTSSCSSNFSSTPPSFIPRPKISDEYSSNGSTLSASPTTPRKEWELRFKSHLKESGEKLEDSSLDSNHNAPQDVLKSMPSMSSSLPPNYFLPSHVQLPKLVPPRQETKFHADGNMNDASSNTHRRQNRNIKSIKSLDDSERRERQIQQATTDNDGWLSGDSDHSGQPLPLPRFQPNSPVEEGNRSVKGGSLFGRLFSKEKKQHKKKEKKAKPEKKTITGGNKLLGKIPSNESLKRRTKSCDLLDESQRSNRFLTRGSGSRYGPVGAVISPHGTLVTGIKLRADPHKEKKLVFTDLRNSAKAKDSATAYLGEEKSIHHGKHFETLKNAKLSDGSLTTVKEEIIVPVDSSQAILNPLEGVESWTQQSKNLIFPAVTAMCRPEVFEMFKSNHTNNGANDSSKSLFGSTSLGSVRIAKLTSVTNIKEEDCKWRRGHFELRQNYLLEYGDGANVSTRPRGYAFLQGATTRRYLHFPNTVQLEFHQHQSTKKRCAVIIKLDSDIEAKKWISCLQGAANLKIEDLYDYDASEGGKELGRGRYATIRPARRRKRSTQNNAALRSSFGNLSMEESGNGILKKKPSFSSFGNLNNLSHENYECALKIVDKKLYWKNVQRGTERADSIVRETCVQAALIAQAHDHKGFLGFKSFFETQDKVVLELELLEGNDLYDYVKTKRPLSELEASKIMCDILGCMVVMKNLGIAHRDLKPANILMADKSNRYGKRVKVGDFGHATFVGKDNLVRGRCGTVGYVAPEILRAEKNSGYGNKVDEFSAGAILYVLLCGYEPFYGETEKKLIEENKRAVVEFPEEDWQSISLEGRDLVEKLLTRDPLKRIDAGKALQHPWITRRALRQRQTIINDNNDQLFGTDEFACTIS